MLLVHIAECWFAHIVFIQRIMYALANSRIHLQIITAKLENKWTFLELYCVFA